MTRRHAARDATEDLSMCWKMSDAAPFWALVIVAAALCGLAGLIVLLLW